MYHMYYMYHVGVKKAKLAKANVWLYLFGVITAVAPLPWSHWAVTFFESVDAGPQGLCHVFTQL